MQRHYRSKGSHLIECYADAHKGSSFSAKQIVDYAKECDVKIDIATIYRNLEKMVTDGLLLKTKSQESDSVIYQFVEEHHDCHNHLHARCKNCGKIIHLEDETAERFINQVMERYGFAIKADLSTICGLCSDCRN